LRTLTFSASSVMSYTSSKWLNTRHSPACGGFSRARTRRAEGLAEVHPGQQPLGVLQAINPHTKDHTLHDVGRPQAPNLGGEHNVVGTVDFAPVTPRPGLAGEGQPVLPTSAFDLEQPFGNVQIGSAVLPHRPQLHQVRFGADVSHSEKQVKGSSDVVGLDEDRVLHGDHRVRRRQAFAEVHNGLGLELTEEGLYQSVLAQVSLPEEEFLAEASLECPVALS
jgi:hypothetical protein